MDSGKYRVSQTNVKKTDMHQWGYLLTVDLEAHRQVLAQFYLLKFHTGFALGSVEGRVAIQYPQAQAKDTRNFTFKCHRSNGPSQGIQDIFAVNDIAFHPVHGTLATVGSDGRWAFWDKDARTKLKTGEPMEQPITSCAFNATGAHFFGIPGE